MTRVIDQAHGAAWTFYNADCVELTAGLPDNSIDHCVYSPPFSSLYIYSESERDMGNSADDDEFFRHYSFLLKELHRVTRPGRVHAVHVKDLVYYQGSSARGTAGLRDFSGEVIRAYIAAGFDFHSRITVYRDPVLERAKTNAHGLLWKTFQADATFCRTGLPEYVLVFRKWPQNDAERALVKPVPHPKSKVPLEAWQDLASPVWTTHEPEMWLSPTGHVWNLKPSGMGDGDLPVTDTLNVKAAREDRDEKHLCPMPLNITRRCLRLWSGEGDVVYSPFGGIGSEGYVCMQEGRRFVGAELKPAYWERGCRYLAEAEAEGRQGGLFEAAA